MALQIRNPYSQSVIGEVAAPTDADIATALKTATQAFHRWQNVRSQERSDLLNAVANALETERESFARLICDEAGKPMLYARVEVDRALGVLRWAAAEALRFGGEVLRLDTTKAGRPGLGIVTRFPRGVILGITPFNFPINLAAHKVAPALAAGNAIIVKPSPATPLTTKRFADLFEKCGGTGLVQVLMANDNQTAKLTQADEIAMISFTGSAKIGWLIRSQAHRKPVTLELGGNAWCYIADDVPASEYAAIAKRIANAAFGYAGQSCISIQNVATSPSGWSKLEQALAEATTNTKFGDPTQDGVISGPVINAAAKTRIESDLAAAGGRKVSSSAAVGSGAQVLAPTLVVAPELNSKLVQEEIFGPVMTAHQIKSFDEFVQLVNNNRYGLQTGVYTQNYALIERAYRELHVGGVIVNDVPTTRYDHQPYGGLKDSGMGREGIEYAMEEMTEPKFLALSSTRPL